MNRGKRFRKTKDFGDFREIENFIVAPMQGNHNRRSPKTEETAEAIAKINDRKAVEKVEDKIKANFKPRDWYLTLTYFDDSRPDDEIRAKKDLRNFNAAVDRYCDKQGRELKYLKTTEQGERSGHWHHHVILPGWIPLEEIEKRWGKGTVHAERLWSDGNNSRDGDRLNVHRLAEYFVGVNKRGKKSEDRPKYKKRYSFSRNCIAPKITYEEMSPKWLKTPKTPKGWLIVPGSLQEWEDGYGFRHQRYTIVRDKNRR